MSQDVGGEAPVECAEVGRRDAAVCDHPGDQDGVASPPFQDGFEVRTLECVHLCLADDRIPFFRRKQSGIEGIHSFRNGFPVVHLAGVADIDNRVAGRMEARYGLIDRAHPLRRGGPDAFRGLGELPLDVDQDQGHPLLLETRSASHAVASEP